MDDSISRYEVEQIADDRKYDAIRSAEHYTDEQMRQAREERKFGDDDLREGLIQANERISKLEKALGLLQ